QATAAPAQKNTAGEREAEKRRDRGAAAVVAGVGDEPPPGSGKRGDAAQFVGDTAPQLHPPTRIEQARRAFEQLFGEEHAPAFVDAIEHLAGAGRELSREIRA